jgi:predicted methyltransferase
LKTLRIHTVLAGCATLTAMLCVSPRLSNAADPTSVEHASAVPDSQIPKYITDAIHSPDRPGADKALDEARRPGQVMMFFGIKPGMQVADIFAAGGTTTEVLARIVGPSGKVYSQNIQLPARLRKAEDAWKGRLKEPGMTNVVEVTKPLDAPDLLPVEPGSLDAVIVNQNYHDMVWLGVDRAKLNATIFRALKSGGVYAIVDNADSPGSGAKDVKTLHRIDPDFEIAEIEKAGFKLAATSDVLHNPNDPHTEPAVKMNHMEDRFVLKFVKP